MTVGWFDVVIIVLGAWRITRLVTRDTFPPAQWARDWVLERHPTVDTVFLGSHVTDPTVDATTTIHGTPVFTATDELSAWVPATDTAIGALVTCVWCTGFWVSAIAVAAWWFIPMVAVPVLAVFAVAAAVGIVDRLDP